MQTLVCVILTSLLWTAAAYGQQQYFRVRPQDTHVKVGDTAILRCEVNNQAGSAQWTKDGFALGFERNIPGFARYAMVGDEALGTHNLRIVNASLRDDAEYQCQVGPARFITPIRANARLFILVPPSSTEIVDHARGSKITIRENERLELQCHVKGAKPAATIVWFRDNAELKLEGQDDETHEQTVREDDKDVVKTDTQSRISFSPTAEDDGATYACEARHPALGTPQRAAVVISVQYPPGAPHIEGYTEGEVVRMGHPVTLLCVSRGGNPLAEIVWYKNDRRIDSSYTTTTRESRNEYTFTADTTDNNARYRCEASNPISPTPMKTEITMTVQFAPKEIRITGPSEASVGDIITLHCNTSNSNPPAVVSWFKGGLPVQPYTNRTVTAPDGGWLTSSNLTIEIQEDDRNLMITCQGVNQYLGESKVASHMVSIIQPPNPPMIYGHGPNLIAGKLQRITCLSAGGNPLATLTWYKGNQKLTSVYTTNGNVASAELAVVANMTDNGAEYRCESSNKATREPLQKSFVMTVLFPPAQVKIKKKPRKLKDGEKAWLTCESGSSNPEAKLTWWHEGLPIEGYHNNTRDGVYGGKQTINTLELNVTPELDGAVYTCQANNEALRQSVHDAIALEVMYKPQFLEPGATKRDIKEGESTTVQLEARANPVEITYSWTRDGAPVPSINDGDARVTSNGPVLNVTRVQKSDAGTYMCEATNSEGSSQITIQLNVQYPPRVVEMVPWVVANEGEDAHLECKGEGNPLEKEMISWRRENFDMGRTKVTYKNDVSYLVLIEVQQKDTGPFECTINNNVGEPAKGTVYLITKQQPQMDTSPQIAKSASEKGNTARLTCRAKGSPNITFQWVREGATVGNPSNDKYEVEQQQLDYITWESILSVRNVNSQDYGAYECVARNDMGHSTRTVVLNVTSYPDRPYFVRVLNTSHDTVYLTWEPGFDGGLTQSYRVRYRPVHGTGRYRYMDVDPPNATLFAVTGLSVGTEYLFDVEAFNERGTSNYTDEKIMAKTSSEAPLKPTSSSDVDYQPGQIPKLLIVTITIVGTALLVLNVVLIAFFVRRRSKKRMTAASEQGSSKSATMEMYAPSSYNETVTGETLSSISEKSESYSNNGSNEDYIVRHKEDSTKPGAASTYLIDQMDHHLAYPPPDSHGSRQNTLSRHKPNNMNVEDDYVDALRRNAYNQTLGDKPPYGKTTPRPPSRAQHHQPPSPDTYYNIAPDSRYVPYPPPGFGPPVGNGSLHHHNIPPSTTPTPTATPVPYMDQNGTIPRSARYNSTGVGTEITISSPVRSLTTFNPNPSPSPTNLTVVPLSSHDYETEGHLV